MKKMIMFIVFALTISNFAQASIPEAKLTEDHLLPIKHIEYRYKARYWLQDSNDENWQYMMSCNDTTLPFIRNDLLKFVQHLENEAAMAKKNNNNQQEGLEHYKAVNTSLIIVIVLMVLALLSVFIVKKCQSKKAPDYTLLN